MTNEITDIICRIYENEIKDFPHPRSPEAVEANAKNWGIKVGVPFAEAFEVVRIINNF